MKPREGLQPPGCAGRPKGAVRSPATAAPPDETSGPRSSKGQWEGDPVASEEEE